MTLHRMVNGEQVELTAEEEAGTRAEWAANEAAQKATQWFRDRQGAYPLLADQLDAMWKGGEEMEKMRARVMKVKTDFPKPQ